MGANLRKILAFTISLCCCFTTAANSEDPFTIRVTKVDTTAFPEVTVQFSAWDSSGIPLSGLTAQDVFIQEDENSEIHPSDLNENVNTSLAVALVLDVSGSMEGKPLSDAQNAANRFLEKLDANDQVAVIAFANGVNVDPEIIDPGKEVDFSSDLTGAFNLIEGLRAVGGTEVYNAIEKAVGLAAQLPEGHRVVLLLTDGKNDPANVGNPQNAIDLAKQERIPVFAIGLGSEIDEDYLQSLTSETGGLYRLTPRSSELSALFNDMAALMKTSYALTYQSSIELNGEDHNLALRLITDQGTAVAKIVMDVLPQEAELIVEPEEAAPSEAEAFKPSAPLAEAVWFEQNQLAVYVGIFIIIILLVILFASKKKKPVMVEKCAHCGSELKDDGPCTVCGSSKKIKARK